MTGRVIVLFSLLIGVIAATTSQALAADPLANVRANLAERIMMWDDRPDEVAYHVTGEIFYLHFSACGRSEPSHSETVNVDEELPADTTVFYFPPPSDQRADSIKDYQISVDALGLGGEVLAYGGSAFTADQFCTPEEIAAGLAAAGTGPSAASGWPDFSLLGALIGLGILGIAGGTIIRRMTR